VRVLLTGASGFLGSQLAKELERKDVVDLVVAVRRRLEIPNPKIFEVKDLDANTDWSQSLSEVDVVIHTAAITHIMKNEVANELSEYRRVNVDGTLNLARQALAAGVKRFIFISSIKVNGEQTSFGQPFTEDDMPAPEGAYGVSKWEAEQGLRQLAAETGMELVIIRPPLVYGPGVKGNFASMMKLISMGLPLPLGAIHNQRTLVALDNLVDLIVTCIGHPAAANEVFLAGDGQDLSTTELLRGVAIAMGKQLNLLPVPQSLLMLGATLLGKREVAKRLLGSLQLDISKTKKLLAWEPPISVEEGLKRCFEPKIH
jgi:nucleoside-diphosphate-sugar epimerase